MAHKCTNEKCDMVLSDKNMKAAKVIYSTCPKCNQVDLSDFTPNIPEPVEIITDGGMDRGCDAVYVDDREGRNSIHVFQFKYVNSFDKTKNNFPGGEIDKLVSFFEDVLDEKAQQEYKQRITDLQEQLQEAEEMNDLGRNETISTELDQLVEHLSKSFGLAGKVSGRGQGKEILDS